MAMMLDLQQLLPLHRLRLLIALALAYHGVELTPVAVGVEQIAVRIRAVAARATRLLHAPSPSSGLLLTVTYCNL